MGWVMNATFRSIYPWERPGIHCIGGWVGPGAGLDRCGKSPTPGFDPQTVQTEKSGAAAQRYRSQRSVRKSAHMERDFNAYWTVHHCDNCRIKKPTRCHLIFYCTSYRLNMFQTLLCPPSGANLQPTANQERHDQCGKQHHSRELPMMGIVVPETCWALKKYNKISSGI